MTDFIAQFLTGLLPGLLRDQRGATLLENAVMWGVLAVVAAGVFGETHAGANFSEIAATFNLPGALTLR